MRSAVCLALVACLALASLPSARADVYINSPRGSNNRLDEANRDRDNGDRLFDSQNNNRGGYNVGQVYYYTGSTVSIEWTAQHSCGDKSRMNCEILLQYTCDDRIRDGTTTTTIPTNPNQCYDWDCDVDLRFGRHESFKSYETCRFTSRNRGLFLGSQNLNGRDSMRHTRQNPGGTRRGYECAEERDYYPHWAPSVWRDIAVLTNDPDRCPAYQEESQNVKPRFYCQVPEGLMTGQIKKQAEGWIPIDQKKCEEKSFFDKARNVTLYGKWMQKPAFGIDAPICRENQWSRDNHHGNVAGSGGFAASFNWTVPDSLVHERCVLRLRYNISTGDTIEWASDKSIQAGQFGDASSNPLNKNGQENRDPARLAVIWERFGLNWTDVADSFKGLAAENAAGLKNSREYVLKNNPRVDMFGPLLPTAAKSFLKTQLAINTAQYGRTFQDRTHRFAIRQRPANIPKDAIIHNLQVRGKRGNIVQVYPGVEYDFAPNRLHVQQGDYVHFQWTGSNTNPHNNAGNGLEGTDRSNLVIMRPSAYFDGQVPTLPPTKGGWGTSYPGRVDDTVKFAGLSLPDQAYLATLQAVSGVNMPGAQFGGSMDQFDDAGTYFDLGPRQLTQAGIYHYISTRNNAFSNRSQKGKLVVSAVSSTTEAIGRNGGLVRTAGAQRMTVPANAFTGLQMVTFASTPKDASGVAPVKDQSSDFVLVDFNAEGLTGQAPVRFTINYNNLPLHVNTLKRASSATAGDWGSHDSASFSGGEATVETYQPGVYAVQSTLNAGAVAGIVIGCVVFFAIVGVIVWKVYTKNKGATLNKSGQHIKTEVPMTGV